MSDNVTIKGKGDVVYASGNASVNLCKDQGTQVNIQGKTKVPAQTLRERVESSILTYAISNHMGVDEAIKFSEKMVAKIDEKLGMGS